MALDMHVVYVLLVFDCLTRWLAEERTKLGGRLLPLRPGQSLGSNGQFAVWRDGDDELCHWTSDQKRTRMVIVPSVEPDGRIVP